MSSSTSHIAPLLATWTAPKLIPAEELVWQRTGRRQNRIDEAAPLPALHYATASSANGSAIVRQRFYPAQLQRAVGGELHAIETARHQKLSWSGWDRSLPRLYLPVEPLIRLLIEAVDGIMHATAINSSSPGQVNIRIESPRWSDSHLVLALEAPHWQCDARFRGSLNARWFRHTSQTHLWQRLARLGDLVGGWLSVVDLPGGGTSLLINLPTDQPRALVMSWLTKQVATTHRGCFENSPSEDRLRVSLYAIGRSRPESAQQLQAANVRLQSLAKQDDFIYRTAHGRWIWLTLAAELPAFLKTNAWHNQQLDLWDSSFSRSAVIQLAMHIERRFRQLVGANVPPVDLRTHQLSRGPITSKRPHTRVDQPTVVAAANHLQVPVHAKAKWRYPI